MTPAPTAGHTHRIQHFCSAQQEVGIQGGVCADPTCEIAELRAALEDVLVDLDDGKYPEQWEIAKAIRRALARSREGKGGT